MLVLSGPSRADNTNAANTEYNICPPGKVFFHTTTVTHRRVNDSRKWRENEASDVSCQDSSRNDGIVAVGRSDRGFFMHLKDFFFLALPARPARASHDFRVTSFPSGRK